MLGVSLLKGLLIVWAAVTGIMVVLMIYRSTLGAHEEDRLFLSHADDIMEREQHDVLRKEKKIAPYLYVFGTASGVLLLSIVALWIYRGLLMT